MANNKISQFTSATLPLAGTELVPIVQGGVTKKTTVANLPSNSFWGLTGNSGTTIGTNFIGTIDNNGLLIKVNNLKSGYIDIINSNTSFGQFTIPNDGGVQNTAFGTHALGGVVTGNSNTAFGFQTLINNTSGQDNTAVGWGSLYATTSGYRNTGLGIFALEATTTGINNLGLGCYAGRYNNLTSNQIFINSLDRNDYNADKNDSPIYIQQNLTVSNQLITLNGKVGIGTTSPTVPLNVIGDVIFQGSGGLTNFSMLDVTQVINLSTDGGQSIDLNGTTGFTDIASGAAIIRLDGNNNNVLIQPDGVYNVGIGTASPNSTLHNKGSFATAYVAKTANYTLTANDYTVEATSGTFTLTLPSAIGITGRVYFVTNTGAGSVTLETAPSSSQSFANIAGRPSSLAISFGQGLMITSNGVDWLQMSSF